MTNIWKIVLAVAVVAIIVLGFIVYKDSSSNLSFGAVGVKLAENYDPYIRYNGGYNSLLPITTTGPLTVTSTNTATSTTIVGCVQTTATSTATPIRLLYNTQATTSLSGTASGTVVWGYGTCPF